MYKYKVGGGYLQYSRGIGWQNISWSSYYKMASRADFDLYLKTARGLIKPKSFNGIVYLDQNEDFEIVVVNKSSLKVKAKIYLSGYDIGTLALKPYETIPLKKVVEGVDRRFRYCQFGSYEGMLGKLNRERLYSDEITVVFEPEKIAMAQTPMYESMDRIGCASSDLGDRFGCAISNFGKKGLKVQTDFSVECDTSDGGGAILGPNKSHQTFFPVKDFVTHGKYYFTLIMRTRQNNEENIPKIIPLCEMYNKNLMNSNI